MSKAKPKYWITTKYGNRIGHRKLDPFEERNPVLFNLGHRKHDTWAEAHATVLAQRVADVAKLRHHLKLAEAQLEKARYMKQPEATP